MNKKEIKEILDSRPANDIILIGSYVINKTETTKDNEIVLAISDYSDLIAEKINAIANSNPTNKELKRAVMSLLDAVSKKLDKRWVTIILKIVNWFI